MKIITTILIATSFSAYANMIMFGSDPLPGPGRLGMHYEKLNTIHEDVSARLDIFDTSGFMLEIGLVEIELSKKGYDVDSGVYFLKYIIPDLKEDSLNISTSGMNIFIKGIVNIGEKNNIAQLTQKVELVERLPADFEKNTITHEYKEPILNIFFKKK